MPEYKRQWVVELKRKGLDKEPNKDSLTLKTIEDRLKLTTDTEKKKQLLFKRDSIVQKLKNSAAR